MADAQRETERDQQDLGIEHEYVPSSTLGYVRRHGDEDYAVLPDTPPEQLDDH